MSVIEIEVVDVSIQNQGKYGKMTVTYKTPDNRGQIKTTSKAMVDFATAKEVWATLSTAVKGDHFQVEQNKNEKGFWDWVGISRQDGLSALTKEPAPASPAPSSAKPNFADMDAKKQRYIIRQSSLAQAVNAIGPSADHTDYTTLAGHFADWVLEQETV